MSTLLLLLRDFEGLFTTSKCKLEFGLVSDWSCMDTWNHVQMFENQFLILESPVY